MLYFDKAFPIVYFHALLSLMCASVSNKQLIDDRSLNFVRVGVSFYRSDVESTHVFLLYVEFLAE